MLPADFDELAPGGPRTSASPVEAARAKLDLALLALQTARDPRMARARAEAALQAALLACYAALRSRHDHAAYHEARDAAVSATREALAALQDPAVPDRGAARALGLGAAALGLLAGANLLPLEGPSDLPGFKLHGTRAFSPASVDVPKVVDLQRGLLVPTLAFPSLDDAPGAEALALAKAPPPLTTLAEVEAFGAAAAARLGLAGSDDDEAAALLEAPNQEVEPPPPFSATEVQASHEAASQGRAPLTEQGLRFDRARNFLEELAGLGNMRRPVGRDPWAAPRTEIRLLARVDALAACGEGVWPALVKLLEERPLPDPELAWALIFFFGSLRGTDAVDQVERLVLTTDLAAPDMPLFVADALALAPQSALEEPLRRWLRALDPNLRLVAFEALGRRRALTTSEAVLGLGDSHEPVVLAATKHLGAALGSPDLATFAKLLRSPDSAICRAAFASYCRLGHRAPITAARDALMPPAAHDTDERVRARAVDHGDIPLFWALGAAADAWPEMVRALSSWRSPIFFEALGWFGHAEAIPLLLEALRREDEAEKEAASWALFRLTGAPLSDDDAPDKLVPLPAELRWGSTFRPPERPGLLTKEPAIWAAWWKANQAGISPTVRYRFGHAWSPADNLWELEDLQTPTADREPAYLELVLRTGAASVPLDRDDFVAQQRVQMTALRAHCDRSAVRPGEYALRFVR